MDSGADLLRLLAPAVRPGGLPGPVKKPPAGPIEERSFESLLEEAKTLPVDATKESANAAGVAEASAVPNKQDPLAALGKIDQIDNSALRRLIDR